MALIGYERVSTREQSADRQTHDLTKAGCVRVFSETISGGKGHRDRPELARALDYMRPDDVLCVQEVDRLGRNLLDGLIMLGRLFDQGVTVKVLTGIGAGEHRERSVTLDIALALAEERRRDIARKTRNGLEAARRDGRVGGRPRVIDADMLAIARARQAAGESLSQIARALRIPHGKNKGDHPSVASLSRALRAADVEEAQS